MSLESINLSGIDDTKTKREQIPDIMEFEISSINLEPIESSVDKETGEKTEEFAGEIEVRAGEETVIFRLETATSTGKDGSLIEESQYFYIFNTDYELIAEADVDIYYCNELAKVYKMPVTKVIVSKSGERELTDQYPAIGRVLIAKGYQSLFNKIEGPFTDIITRTPEVSRIDEQLSREEWLELFGPFLKENDYKEIELDVWHTVYNKKI